MCSIFALLYTKHYNCHLNFSPSNPQAVNITCLVPSNKEFWDLDASAYAQKKQYYIDSIKEKINNRIPSLAKNFKYLDASTPATFKKYTGHYSNYGICQDSTKIALLPMTKIKGLYLSGQSIIAPGLLGSIITSYIIDKLMEKENV